MVPNTEAKAGKQESSASKLMIAIDRFDILIPPGGTAVRVPGFFAKQQTGLTPEQKNLQKELQHSRNYGRFWSKL